MSSCYPSPDILLVPPSISFWIMNCPAIESLKEFVGPLDLHAKKLVLFPINDNEDVSIVVYGRDTNMFVHHDSNQGMNRKSAKRLHKRVSKFMSESPGLGFDPKFVECLDSPQQRNGYDCGLYVTSIARVILWHHDDGYRDDNYFVVVKEKVTPSAVSEMRNLISGLIRGLIAKK